MGHVSSRALTDKPFVVNLQGSRGHSRIAAIALTQDNLGDEQSPFFRQFYEARIQDTVRHWYCAPPNRSQLPDAPVPSFIHDRFVKDAERYLDCQPNSWTPLPIVLVEMLGRQPEIPTTVAEVVSDEIEIIGYFGCRQFSRWGTVNNYGVLGMFLARNYQNESKSGPVCEIAAACYMHFMRLAGRDPLLCLPAKVTFTTLDTNLPCLRMIQRFLEQYSTDIEKEDVFIQQEQDGRVRCEMSGASIPKMVAALAKRVTTEDMLTWTVEREKPVPLPSAMVHQVLDDLIASARANWRESNAATHQNKPKKPAAAPTPLGVGEIQKPSTQQSGETQVQSQYPSPVAQQQPVHTRLMIRKRTRLTYLKDGVWVSAQWRNERQLVALAADQRCLDAGWLALQPVGRWDIEIFKNDSIPAIARVDQGFFFVDPNGVLTEDPVRGNFVPFQVPVGVVAQPANPATQRSQYQQHQQHQQRQSYVDPQYEQHIHRNQQQQQQQQPSSTGSRGGFQSHAQVQGTASFAHRRPY